MTTTLSDDINLDYLNIGVRNEHEAVFSNIDWLTINLLIKNFCVYINIIVINIDMIPIDGRPDIAKNEYEYTVCEYDIHIIINFVLK